jgi:hypothetical protein
MPTRRAIVTLSLGFLLLMTSGAAQAAGKPEARVTKVSVSGTPSAYTFLVTIASNDTGCQHYADWWEVVDEQGGLVYRRVLLHDHADEQPFSRDGGPVAIGDDQIVTVRAHMNTSGYSPAAMRGSAKSGFQAIDLPDGFAAGLAKKQPLPGAC